MKSSILQIFAKTKMSIDQREPFEFQDPELPRRQQVQLRIQTFFSKEGTEEHHFQEALYYYRFNGFFTSQDLATNA